MNGVSRVLAALPLGAIATAALFYFMAVITDDSGMIEDGEVTTPSIDFAPARVNETTKTKARELPQPPEPIIEVPSVYASDAPAAMNQDLSNVPFIDIPALAESHSMSGGMLVSIPGVRRGAGDGRGIGRPEPTSDVIPLVRVPPQYPMRALMNRTEGWVLVVFSISETGGVMNPQVVQAEPPRVFDQAALRAVSRWKYSPRIINGKPEVRHGVRVVIDFEMADAPEGQQ